MPLVRKTPLRRTSMKRRPKVITITSDELHANPTAPIPGSRQADEVHIKGEHGDVVLYRQTKSLGRKWRKPEAGRDPKYLRWLRQQPCAWCGREAPSEAAHMSRAGTGGTGMKATDYGCVPLCGLQTGPPTWYRGCHRFTHDCGTLPNLTDCVHPATVSGDGMRAWAAEEAKRYRAAYLTAHPPRP